MFCKRTIVSPRCSKANYHQGTEIAEAENTNEFQEIDKDGVFWFDGLAGLFCN